MTVAAQAVEDRFASMSRQMSRWVEQALGPGYHDYCPGESWSPAVNAFEDDSTYCVVVDLAGVKAEGIDLRIEHRDGNELIVSGSREAPAPPSEGKPVRLHTMEIDHGRFSRTLDLPEDIDVDRIEAKYDKGFLWVTLPKKP